MLNVKQEGIKYHFFWVFGIMTRDWALVSQDIGKILISLLSPCNCNLLLFLLFLSLFFLFPPISILRSNFYVSTLEPKLKYNILYEVLNSTLREYEDTNYKGGNSDLWSFLNVTYLNSLKTKNFLNYRNDNQPGVSFLFLQTMNPDPYRGPWGGSHCRDSPVQVKYFERSII